MLPRRLRRGPRWRHASCHRDRARRRSKPADGTDKRLLEVGRRADAAARRPRRRRCLGRADRVRVDGSTRCPLASSMRSRRASSRTVGRMPARSRASRLGCRRPLTRSSWSWPPTCPTSKRSLLRSLVASLDCIRGRCGRGRDRPRSAAAPRRVPACAGAGGSHSPSRRRGAAHARPPRVARRPNAPRRRVRDEREHAGGPRGDGAVTAEARHAARMSRVRITAIGPSDDVAERDDLVAGEEPLQILAAGPGQEPIEVAVTMRTPGHEDELAIGFLVSEGLITPDDVTGVTYADPASASRPDDAVTVHLRARSTRRASPPGPPWPRPAAGSAARRASTTSCAAATRSRTARPSTAATILALPAALRAAQETFEATGGLHAAGLFTPDGELHHAPRGRRAPQRPRQAHRRARAGRGAAAARDACCW